MALVAAMEVVSEATEAHVVGLEKRVEDFFRRKYIRDLTQHRSLCRLSSIRCVLRLCRPCTSQLGCPRYCRRMCIRGAKSLRFRSLLPRQFPPNAWWRSRNQRKVPTELGQLVPRLAASEVATAQGARVAAWAAAWAASAAAAKMAAAKAGAVPAGALEAAAAAVEAVGFAGS